MHFKLTASSSAKTLAFGRSSGFIWFVRGGFVARGLVYGVIGGLALALALGAASGTASNQQGAFSRIAAAPFGVLALVVLAAGVLAYAVWQIGQAILGRGLERGALGIGVEPIGYATSS